MESDLVDTLLARPPKDERMLPIWKTVAGDSVSELSQMTGPRQSAIKVRLFTVVKGLFRLLPS